MPRTYYTVEWFDELIARCTAAGKNVDTLLKLHEERHPSQNGSGAPTSAAQVRDALTLYLDVEQDWIIPLQNQYNSLKNELGPTTTLKFDTAPELEQQQDFGENLSCAYGGFVKHVSQTLESEFPTTTNEHHFVAKARTQMEIVERCVGSALCLHCDASMRTRDAPSRDACASAMRPRHGWTCFLYSYKPSRK